MCHFKNTHLFYKFLLFIVNIILLDIQKNNIRLTLKMVDLKYSKNWHPISNSQSLFLEEPSEAIE